MDVSDLNLIGDLVIPGEVRNGGPGISRSRMAEMNLLNIGAPVELGTH